MESTNESRRSLPELELLGGDISLDFANTVDRGRSGRSRHEYLFDYESLVDWARHAEIIDDRTSVRLRQLASQKPDAASRVLNDALSLRRTIQSVFAAVAAGSEPESDELDELGMHFLRAANMSRLRQGPTTFDWLPVTDLDHLDSVLWSVTLSAVDLLRDDQLDRVKRCPGDDGQCGWLFLDRTRNRSRRWCSMQTCGSRDKMRRLYRRSKSNAFSDT